MNLNFIYKIFVIFCLVCFLPASYAITAPVANTQPPGVALVLGGGGARGFAHIGVLQVLEQYKVPINLIVGTSAGSMIGGLYADNPHADQVGDLLLDAKKSNFVHMSLLHIKNGVFVDKPFQDFFQTNLKAKYFSQLKIKFIAVATDLATGEMVPFSQGLIVPAINASAALPPFYHPVAYQGMTLVDGGMSDPVPVDLARQAHAKVIIAVDISQDLPPNMPTNLLQIYARSKLIQLRNFSNESDLGAGVVIKPFVGNVSAFDSTQKIALVKAGQQATEAAMPQICALLRANHIPSLCS